MIKREESSQGTFADVWLSHTEKKWGKHWLKKVRDNVNWNKFQYRFEKLYCENNGRPAWDPLVLFRCLLLAQWNNLSDRQLEEAVEFRIDFRKFVGLGWDEEAPDATTFCVFRERIMPIMDTLMRILNDQLKAAGFEIQKAVAVDAALIEAHSIPEGEYGGDTEASWRGFPEKISVNDKMEVSVSRRPALFGFKANLSVSVGQGFVGAVSVCKASEHDSLHLEDVLSDETQTVYADKGYVGCKQILKSRGIRDGIQDKGYSRHPLTAAQISRNKRISHFRYIVEGVFGGWKQWYDWRKTKYMGLAKNTLAVTLTALAWNIKKWAALTP